MRTFLPSTPTRSSPCAHHQRTTRRPAHSHRRPADSAKEVFLDDVLSDIDPQTGDVSHRETAVRLRPRVEHQLLLHWRFMRLEVHTMTLGRNGKQMHTRRCIQRTAPGVEAKVEVLRLNELDHIVATRNAKTPAWIHLHHVDAPCVNQPMIAFKIPFVLARPDRGRHGRAKASMSSQVVR